MVSDFDRELLSVAELSLEEGAFSYKVAHFCLDKLGHRRGRDQEGLDDIIVEAPLLRVSLLLKQSLTRHLEMQVNLLYDVLSVLLYDQGQILVERSDPYPVDAGVREWMNELVLAAYRRERGVS